MLVVLRAGLHAVERCLARRTNHSTVLNSLHMDKINIENVNIHMYRNVSTLGCLCVCWREGGGAETPSSVSPHPSHFSSWYMYYVWTDNHRPVVSCCILYRSMCAWLAYQAICSAILLGAQSQHNLAQLKANDEAGALGMVLFMFVFYFIEVGLDQRNCHLLFTITHCIIIYIFMTVNNVVNDYRMAGNFWGYYICEKSKEVPEVIFMAISE